MARRAGIQRVEKALDRVGARETELHEAMAASATDHARLRALQAELAAQTAERERLEAAWLQIAELLEA